MRWTMCPTKTCLPDLPFGVRVVGVPGNSHFPRVELAKLTAAPRGHVEGGSATTVRCVWRVARRELPSSAGILHILQFWNP